VKAAPWLLVGCARLPLPVNKQGTTDPFGQHSTAQHGTTLLHGSHLHIRRSPSRNKRLLKHGKSTEADTMNNDHQASTNYREAFQLFDKRGNGRVDRGSLGDLLRACGQNPTLAEIADLERGVGADCTSPRPYTRAAPRLRASTHVTC
jgi:hypothetical protein